VAKHAPNIFVIIALLLAGCSGEKANPTAAKTSKTKPASPAQTEAKGLPAAAPMRGTGELPPNDAGDTFTFVVFGDNRPAKGDPQPDTIKEIFNEINDLKPSFALSLGDVIEGKPQPGDADAITKIRQQMDGFLKLAATANAPIYNAPGNHEMDDDQDIPTQRMHDLYHEIAGPSYGAFNFGASRFILLNTEDVPAADTPPPAKDAEFSYMSPRQIAELKADLDANRDKKHIFICMHYPIHAKDEGPPNSTFDDRLYPESREALLELFKDYDNIAYVMAAHGHLYYNPQSPDNITDVPGWQPGAPINYLVSGGAGAPLNAGKWGFHHYLIFSVDGENVTVELVKLQSTGSSY
jgi:hypothetical protein